VTGPYRVSLGMYHPDTGSRLAATWEGRTFDTVVSGPLILVK
jgi:hypothetical protein